MSTPGSSDANDSIEPTVEDQSSPLDWFLHTLQQAMEEVMASSATPLDKSGAISRLGNLFLKALRASELEAEKRRLTQQVADLEARVAAAHQVVDEYVELSHAWAERIELTQHARAREASPDGSPAAFTPPTRDDEREHLYALLTEPDSRFAGLRTAFGLTPAEQAATSQQGPD